MKSTYSRGTCVAAVFAFTIAGFAHATTSQARAAQEERTKPEQQVTVTGCVQSEADYRRAHDAGRGGVAGTGVGAGNEFVLINASISTGSASAASATAAYELTGANEKQAAQYVGQRVQISGKLKAAEVGAAGRPTGGVTAGKPPEGIDVGGKDLKLRELEVGSVSKASGTCPPA